LMNLVMCGNRLGYWSLEILVKFDVNYWSPSILICIECF
jgi:hypothetical protein